MRGGLFFVSVSASGPQPFVLVRNGSGCLELLFWATVDVDGSLGIAKRERTVLRREKSGVGRWELNTEEFPSRSRSGDLSAGVKGTSLNDCG